MQTSEYFAFLVNEIHSVIAATVDDNGKPVTCAIDIMDHDEDGLYFLTAKGKGFYKRLKNQEYIAFTGMKGNDTMSRIAVSVSGKVREIGSDKLPRLLEKNPYMYEIYPTESSRSALTVFKIYDGSGEWFDLSKKPIEREEFTFGEASKNESGYFVSESCIGCSSCLSVCPQSCIDIINEKAVIRQQNCLHCGNCLNICPVSAITERGQL